VIASGGVTIAKEFRFTHSRPERLKLERQSKGVRYGMGNGGLSTSCRSAQVERDTGRNDSTRDREKPMLPFYGASLPGAYYVNDNPTGRNFRRFIRCNGAHCVFI
jgi:hypothetical protein